MLLGFRKYRQSFQGYPAEPGSEPLSGSSACVLFCFVFHQSILPLGGNVPMRIAYEDINSQIARIKQQGILSTFPQYHLQEMSSLPYLNTCHLDLTSPVSFHFLYPPRNHLKMLCIALNFLIHTALTWKSHTFPSSLSPVSAFRKVSMPLLCEGKSVYPISHSSLIPPSASSRQTLEEDSTVREGWNVAGAILASSLKSRDTTDLTLFSSLSWLFMSDFKKINKIWDKKYRSRTHDGCSAAGSSVHLLPGQTVLQLNHRATNSKIQLRANESMCE